MFWRRKIESNRARDKKVCRQLRVAGWNVLVLWQCQTRKLGILEKRLASFISKPRK